MMRVLILCLAAFAFGCSLSTEPEADHVVSYLNFNASGDPLIDLPASVAVGEEFTVTIETMWGDHCAKKGITVVEAESLASRITPHEVPLTGVACIQVPKMFTREVTLRFNQKGTARVVVRGRNLAGDVVAFERAVTVQ